MTACVCVLHRDGECLSEEGCCPLGHNHCACHGVCSGGFMAITEDDVVDGVLRVPFPSHRSGKPA